MSSSVLWLAKKVDQRTLHKDVLLDILFADLIAECKQAAPGARLSYGIRSRLDRLTKSDRHEIVSQMKDGCAPLFVACKKGNVEIVEYLIGDCDADVEQRGTFEVPDDNSIHHVTPLWCAAVAGKLPVVKCLVENGASVNSVSDTGSTPVRSACFMTHLDIVTYLVEKDADIKRPNYNGGTCLINSVQSVPLCEFLIQHGAVVSAHDIQCKTALHYAIQEHRFETTKLLLDNSADPLMRSRYGDDALQTACLKGAKHIFNYLIDHVQYSRQRIAEAHELIGSTFLDELHDLPTALEHWRTALEIRLSNPDGIIHKPSLVTPLRAYQNAVEFKTLEELENFALDLDAMRIQSLLICERILGPLHKDMSFRLMYRGAAYADSLQYQRCIDLWRYALELRLEKDGILHNEACFTSEAVVRLYLDLLEKYANGILLEEVQFSDIVETIELLSSQFEESMRLLSIRPIFKRQQTNLDKILEVVSHLFYILKAVAKSEEQLFEMKCLVHRIIRMNPRTSNGDTLLHLVTSSTNTMKSSAFFEDPHTMIFPCLDVVQLLVECGADINATNNTMSTPLHTAARSQNYNQNIVILLLNNGAHIDQVNLEGCQPDIMLSTIPACTINFLQYINLKCFAARKIVQSRLPYRGTVPASLEDYIQFHTCM